MSPDPTELLPEDTYRILGRNIRVRSNSRDVLDHLRLVYGNFLESESARTGEGPAAVLEVLDDIEASGVLVVRDGVGTHTMGCLDIRSYDLERYEPRGGSTDPLSAVQWLLLNQVSTLSTDHILVHGAAVAWRGRGLVLPARSGRGKTTLALKLAARGFDYLSDEIACFSRDAGTIEPFPRRASLTPESRRLLGGGTKPGGREEALSRRGKSWVGDDEGLAPEAASIAYPLECVAFLNGFGEKPRLTRVSGATGLFALFQHLLGPVHDAGAELYDLATLLEDVACYDLVVGEPDPTAELLQNLLEGVDGNGQGAVP